MDKQQTGRDAAIGVGGDRLNVQEITEAGSINPGVAVVHVTIPLAAANSYAVALPPAAECFGQKILVRGIRASGTYVDGEVTVTPPTDGVAASGITTDPMTATNDYVWIENVQGLFWRQIAELSTP